MKALGRKKNFSDGFTPKQELAALLLSLGKTQYEVCKTQKIGQSTLCKWMKDERYRELVEAYKVQYLKRVEDEAFDDTKFLTDTMVESMKSTAHRADGLRAREIMARIRGEYSPDELNLKISKELEKLSDEDLEELKKGK